MKIVLKKHPSGLILCQITDQLTDNEQELLLRGIAKFLANGKTRVLVEFDAKVPKESAEKIEKALAPQTELAKKLGGEIQFVLPGGAEAPGGQGVSAEAQLATKLLKAEAEIEWLKEEKKLLLDKIEQLMSHASKPSSDSELKAAVDHYRALAETIEAEKAAPAGKKA